MRIVLSGRKTGKTCVAFYEHNKATFRKKALNRRTVIHELFHHLIEAKGLEMPIGKEEKEADAYSSGFLREIRQG
jgi:hypothetical protein